MKKRKNLLENQNVIIFDLGTETLNITIISAKKLNFLIFVKSGNNYILVEKTEIIIFIKDSQYFKKDNN
jgi:hypothetical protein